MHMYTLSLAQRTLYPQLSQQMRKGTNKRQQCYISPPGFHVFYNNNGQFVVCKKYINKKLYSNLLIRQSQSTGVWGRYWHFKIPQYGNFQALNSEKHIDIKSVFNIVVCMNPIFLAMAIMGMIVDDFSLMTYSDRSMIFKKVRGGGCNKKR